MDLNKIVIKRMTSQLERGVKIGVIGDDAATARYQRTDVKIDIGH